MLYTISRSPWQRDIRPLCQLAKVGDAVVLMQDGVLAGLKDSAPAHILSTLPVEIYALTPDLQARGLPDRLAEGIQPIDYDTLVTLTEAHKQQLAW